MQAYIRGLGALLVLAGIVSADNWPGWRGPRGDGHSFEKNIPLKWDRTNNIRWKVELPQGGNASPVIWGDRVFITCAADAKGHKRAVMCFARKDGQLLWQREIDYSEDEPTHQ